jgi:uncharacterized protein (TIGR03083 family)
MTSPADATIDALRSGHDELVVLVAHLDDDALAGPSGCRDWDLSQVLSHLGSGAEISLGTLQQALDPTTPKVPNTEIWDRWNAMTRLERLSGFLSADETLVEAYESLDEHTRQTLPIDVGFLPAPVDVATAAGLRLGELALHSWDVRCMFDPEAGVADESVPLLLETVAGRLAWSAKPDQVEGGHAVLVETTEPDRRFGLIIADTATLGEVPEQPDATLRLPAEAWLRLVSGRLTPARTPAAVSAEGTLSLEDLRRVFPGY